jgi:hypothetical protein
MHLRCRTKNPDTGFLHGQSRVLYGLTRQQAYAGNGGSEGIPSVNTMGLDVPAGDSNVAAVRDFADEGWQQLGRMLKIGINYAQQVGISLRPAIRNGTGQSSLVRSHQKTYARFRFGKSIDYAGGAVSAPVIDDENFPYHQ